jgi:small subunit ribosomal protein S21
LILVQVHAGNKEKAISDLKRKMQRELVFRSLRAMRAYEPPSVKRVRKDQESERRRRKMERKRYSQD